MTSAQFLDLLPPSSTFFKVNALFFCKFWVILTPSSSVRKSDMETPMEGSREGGREGRGVIMAAVQLLAAGCLKLHGSRVPSKGGSERIRSGSRNLVRASVSAPRGPESNGK